ncbi:DUF2087 domain-containing protein [Candidatus Izemoplasma sp. B36]|uniref:DUF2087 domain-containing protein n=1 Tax=Candidatus Izemoplasma sp. B36 TaxID=3242468 RepID=UPI0035578FF3
MYEYSEKDVIKAKSAFFISLDPLKLREVPTKQKKVFVVLNIIIEQIPDREFSEKEINELLESIYPDFVTLRRYLIDYKLMDRTRDGSKYWKNK